MTEWLLICYFIQTEAAPLHAWFLKGYLAARVEVQLFKQLLYIKPIVSQPLTPPSNRVSLHHVIHAFRDFGMKPNKSTAFANKRRVPGRLVKARDALGNEFAPPDARAC